MKPRAVDGLVAAVLPDGDTVASVPASGSALILNGVGGAVLDLCDGQRSIEDIVSFLCDHLQGADRASVATDVAALIERLMAAGLVADAESCGAAPSEG